MNERMEKLAGTIQAFVPNEKLPRFVQGMEAVLGAGSCHCLKIRARGGVRMQ